MKLDMAVEAVLVLLLHRGFDLVRILRWSYVIVKVVEYRPE